MKTIRIVHPASPLTEEKFQEINTVFLDHDFELTQGKTKLTPNRFFSGNIQERIQEISEAFLDQDSCCIIAQKGGYGSGTLLPYIDYQLIKKNPKIFFGISDITALQNALYTCINFPSYTGFSCITALSSTENKFKLLNQLLMSSIPFSFKTDRITGKKTVKAPLIGGNLTNFVSLIGTPFFPSPKNKILLIEEISEAPYKIDRYLNQLKLAGVLEAVSGIIIGSFFQCDYNNTTAQEVLDFYFRNFNKPIAWYVPYGHAPSDNLIFPIGSEVAIDPHSGIISYSPIIF